LDVWLQFLVSAAVVAAAGVRLARDGDTLAQATGLGGMWMGAILVAAMTSLPELSTGVSAVLAGHPSLAGGDIFGACMANMMILALADLSTRGGRMLTRVSVNQALVGTLAIGLCVIAALGILLDGPTAGLPVGVATLLIGFVYAAGMRLLHVNRGAPPFRTEAEVAEMRPSTVGARRAIVGFTAGALMIVVAAPIAAVSAAEIADRLQVSHGFAGAVFLALTTTLPEAAVTVGAVRAGAYGLAVGNLLGSSCFNVATLVVLDVVHGPGSILAAFDPSVLIAALFSVLLIALAVLEVLNKSERRLWLLEPGPTFMLVAYGVGLFAVFHSGVVGH